MVKYKHIAPSLTEIENGKRAIRRLWLTRIAEKVGELLPPSYYLPPHHIGELARGLILIATTTRGEEKFRPIYIRDILLSSGYTNSYVGKLFRKLKGMGLLRYVEIERRSRTFYYYILPNEVREKIREGLKEAIEEYDELIKDLEARKKGVEELLQSI